MLASSVLYNTWVAPEGCLLALRPKLPADLGNAKLRRHASLNRTIGSILVDTQPLVD